MIRFRARSRARAAAAPQGMNREREVRKREKERERLEKEAGDGSDRQEENGTRIDDAAVDPLVPPSGRLRGPPAVDGFRRDPPLPRDPGLPVGGRRIGGLTGEARAGLRGAADDGGRSDPGRRGRRRRRRRRLSVSRDEARPLTLAPFARGVALRAAEAPSSRGGRGVGSCRGGGRAAAARPRKRRRRRRRS